MKTTAFSLLLLLAGCDGQAKKETHKNNKPQTTEMEEQLISPETITAYVEKQKDIETEENETEKPYSLSGADLGVAENIVAKGLKNSRYRLISTI